MEKVRSRLKNEMYYEYLDVLKAKMDEIVDYINEQIVVDAVGLEEDGD